MSIPVPCGKCPACLARRVSGWSFRLMQEEKRAISAHFLTLTYDKPPLSRNGFMTLDKKDLQNFFKRLRKEQDKTAKVRIKYYAVGEYGGKTQRPHYHVIIFNVVRLSLIESNWAGFEANGVKLGAVHYGEVSGASIGYTLKYINKPQQVPKHRNDDRLMGFSLMSKGLGAAYLTDATRKYHTDMLFDRCCLPLEGGKKAAMPRYYKDKLYSESQRVQISAWGKQKFEKLTEQKEAELGLHSIVQADLAAFKKQQRDSKTRDKL